MVGALTAILSVLRTPVYRGTARVLLRPNDPAEQLNPSSPVQPLVDPNRYVTAQKSIIGSEAVAQEAHNTVPNISIKDLERKVTVSEGGQSDILDVSATDPQPARARDMANAVAKGYIENRRLDAVAGLQRAVDDVTAKLGPLQDNIKQLDAQIAAPPPGKGDVSALPTEALRETRDAAADQYKTLYARQQELLVDIALKRGAAELVSEAKLPSAPISPKPVRDTLTGILVGLLLGIGISLLREQIDGRLRSPDEVEQTTNLPLLAVLPYDEGSARGSGEPAAIKHPLGPLSEAIRALRTSIQFLGAERVVRVIVITSAVPGEGKSLVAANLAVACAEAGYATGLVSGDLRRSSLSPWFGVPVNAPGLSDLVANLAPPGAASTHNGSRVGSPDLGRPTGVHRPTLAEMVVRSPISNLDVLPSGRVPPNPTELLGSRRMATLLAELAASNDIVIIDTPPLLPVTDAAILASTADGVVLVTALGETHKGAVLRSKSILESSGVRILGVVVNKAPRTSRAYYNAYSAYYGSNRERKQPRRSRRRSEESLPEPMMRGQGSIGRYENGGSRPAGTGEESPASRRPRP